MKRKPWTGDDIRLLQRLIRENTPTRVMGIKLRRSANAIYTKASRLGLSLMPINRSPWNKRKA